MRSNAAYNGAGHIEYAVENQEKFKIVSHNEEIGKKISNCVLTLR